MFKAYASEGNDVSDRQTLTQELRRVGLIVDEALARLDDASALERIQE